MNIILNGQPLETSVQTLAELLMAEGISGSVATAVNGDFVPKTLRTNTPLRDGDLVEVLAPMQGG